MNNMGTKINASEKSKINYYNYYDPEHTNPHTYIIIYVRLKMQPEFSNSFFNSFTPYTGLVTFSLLITSGGLDI